MAEDVQVSEVPLESNHPPKRPGQGILLLFILTCMIAAVLTSVWFFILPQRAEPEPNHVTQWPHGFEVEPWASHQADYDAALAKMRKLADALLAYRDSHGGGVRWPMALEDLQYVGLLAADFEFDGLLSGAALVYQPEMPPTHDPARWAMVHDTEVGWVRSQMQPRPYRGIRAVAAIMADGEVKLIDGEDIGMYGGLNVQEARR